MLSLSILLPNIITFSGKTSESVEGFPDEVHLTFTHISDAYTDQKAQETTNLLLIKFHGDGRGKKNI